MHNAAEKNLTIIGTIRKNRKELPIEFVNVKDRNIKIAMYCFQPDATILYCSKKWKVVTPLSPLHSDRGVETGSEKKSQAIRYYN